MKRFGHRIIYDCASSKLAKVCSIITNGQWRLLIPVSTELMMMFHNLPHLNAQKRDRVEWI